MVLREKPKNVSEAFDSLLSMPDDFFQMGGKMLCHKKGNFFNPFKIYFKHNYAFRLLHIIFVQASSIEKPVNPLCHARKYASMEHTLIQL